MKLFNAITRYGLCAALLLLLSSSAWSQRTVTGKITDAETGEPLPGASVVVVGTTRGAIADIDGKYSLEVPQNSTQLRFAYTGFAEEVIDLSTSSTVDVALKPGTKLDEVVVVGYGTVKSKEVTSSVASLKTEDFNRGNISNPAQLLQGKVAGVTISRPGSDPNGGYAIRLRGLSSLSGGLSPLIVIDGVIGADLNLVDPNDIASIDVLKDGSAAAIYGTRASSGVILITTRKGAAGRSAVDYNGQVSFDQIGRTYDVLTEDEFLAIPGTFDASPGQTLNTNWMDEVSQTGVSQVHNLSLTGGSNRFNYRASFNYRDVEGILRNTGFRNYNGSLAFTQKALSDRLTITGNLFANLRDAQYGFYDAFRYAILFNPSAPVKDETNANYRANGGYAEIDAFDIFNPVAMIEQNVNDGRVNRLLGNVTADLQIISGLNVAVRLAQERTSDSYSEYYNKQARWRGIGRNGFARTGNNGRVNDLFETTVNYTLNLGTASSLKLLGGYMWQEFNNSGYLFEGGDFTTDFFSYNNIGASGEQARGLARTTSYRNQNRLIAFFGRANLNWDDTYFLSAGLRREGSSRFGENNRWALFPFASAGVDFNKLFDINGVDALKLRVGYGVTGNEPRDAYLSQGLLRVTDIDGTGRTWPINGTNATSFLQSQNGNADLQWERKTEINFGVDFSLLDSRLNGSIDVYNRKTNDLLLQFPVAVPGNLPLNTWQNIASFTVTGAELSLGFNAIKKENFSWTPSIVFNTYNVKLTDLGRKDTIVVANVGAPGQNDNYYSIVYNDAPLGQLWGPSVTGVDDQGNYIYKDVNGDGKLEINSFNKDQEKIGDAIPIFELGFTNTFTIGRFDLNFFLRGVFGHDLANEFRVFYESNEAGNRTWNKVKTDNYDPNVKAPSRFNSEHVEKATFLRLDNLTLGYNFRLPADSWFTRARVFFNGQNLFTLTNYSGPDPEPRLGDVGSVDNGGRPGNLFTPDPLAPGIDRRSTYFLARTLTFGVNFGF